MRIGFLTSDKFRQLYEDDLGSAAELERRGHRVTALVWRESNVSVLDGFDLIVMRTPWDWFHHRAQFRAYLESLGTTRARVVNTPAQLLEFADKTYLPRLQARGVAVVPSEQLAPSELHRVPELLAERGWKSAVLKPAFTANAVGARRFEAADSARLIAELGVPTDDEPWLLQPFIPSIVEGELSFIFFKGVFSHAVRKRPTANEWRVQDAYGGQSAPHEASPGEIEQATSLLAQSAPGTVYARVDTVEWKGRLHLMELEVVEPELFFRHAPAAASRFADALLTPPEP